jgi:hypothetical protein
VADRRARRLTLKARRDDGKTGAGHDGTAGARVAARKREGGPPGAGDRGGGAAGPADGNRRGAGRNRESGDLGAVTGRATAGDSADVFVFTYTALAKPVPGTVSITVPAGFSTPQDIAAGAVGYLSTSSSCASFQVSGITTDNGAATVTLVVNCAAKGSGALVYEDVAVPTTAGAYPFAASFTPSGSQSPIAFTAQHSVTVKPGPLASLTLTPAAATILSGGSQAYTAQGFDAYGNSRGNITSATKFKISPNGSCTGATCTATSPGPHIVIGTSNKIINTAALAVTAPAATHLYWVDNNDATGTVNEANLDGTDPQTIITGQDNPDGLAVDSSHIYWNNYGATGNGTVNEANLDGTDLQIIVAGQDLYGLAVDGSHIYWTDRSTVNEANPDGTDPQTIITGQNYPVAVTVDSSHIYWTDYFSGTVNEANLDGTDPQTIITGQNEPRDIVLYGSHIYWTDYFSGTVNEANLDGTDPQTILTGQNSPVGVAVGP